jgi:hypothetical protein
MIPVKMRNKDLLYSRKFDFVFAQGDLSPLATIDQKHMTIDLEELRTWLSISLWGG